MRRLIAPLLLGGGLTFLYAAGPTLPELRRDAKKAFQELNYPQALNLYQEMLKISPEDLSVRKEVMWALWNMRKFNEASTIAQSILKQHPDDKEAKNIMEWLPRASGHTNYSKIRKSALEAYKNEDYSHAAVLFDALDKVSVNSVSDRKDQMWTLLNAGHVQPALEIAKSLLRERPGDTDLHKFIRSSIWKLYEKEQYEEAILWAADLVAKGPNNVENINLMGKMYMANSLPDEARSIFLRSLELDPLQIDIWKRLAVAHVACRELPEAIAIFHKKVAGTAILNKEMMPVYAKALYWNEDFSRAAEAWAKAAEYFPDQPTYKLFHAESLYYMGEREEALKMIRALHEENKLQLATRFLIDDAIVWGDQETAEKLLIEETQAKQKNENQILRLADFYFSKEKYRKTLRVTNQWLQRKPKDISILMVKGTALRGIRNHAQAKRIFRYIISLNPNVVDAYVGLAMCELREKNEARSIKFIDKALSLEPLNPSLTIRKSQILGDLGRSQKAKTVLLDWWKAHPEQMALPVLMYHGITPFPKAPMVAYQEHMSVQSFEEQMKALKKDGYQPITVKELVAWYQGRLELDPKSILISFDDARIDSFKYADPVLQKYGLKATMFTPVVNVEGSRPIAFASWQIIQKYYSTGRWEIESHGADAHRYVFSDNAGNEDLYLVKPRWLSDQDRKETDMEWENRVLEDHRISKEKIKKYIGNNSLGYAFPEGDYGQRVDSHLSVTLNKSAVKKEFACAFVQDGIGLNIRKHGPFFVRRVQAEHGWNGQDLLRHIQNNSGFVKVAQELIRLYLQDGDVDEARKWLKELKKQDPTRELVLLEQSRIERAAGNRRKSVELARESNEIFASEEAAKLARYEWEDPNIDGPSEARRDFTLNSEFFTQKDSSDRRNWGTKQSLGIPLGNYVLLEGLYQGKRYKEKSLKVEDSAYGAAFNLYAGPFQTIQAYGLHHHLSGLEDETITGGGEWSSQWGRFFASRISFNNELYGTAQNVNVATKEDKWLGTLDVKFPQQWQVQVKGRHSDISDGNNRETGQGTVVTPPVWQLIDLRGVGRFTYDHMERIAPFYYSPQKLKQSELGLQFRMGLISDWYLYVRYLPGLAEEENVRRETVHTVETYMHTNFFNHIRVTPNFWLNQTPTYKQEWYGIELEIDF